MIPGHSDWPPTWKRNWPRFALKNLAPQMSWCAWTRIRPRWPTRTAGATEARNLAVKGILAANRAAGRGVVTTAVEHPATLAAALAAITTTTRKELDLFALIGFLVWVFGFAIEVGADEGDELARLDFERHVVDRADRLLAELVLLAQPVDLNQGNLRDDPTRTRAVRGSAIASQYAHFTHEVLSGVA